MRSMVDQVVDVLDEGNAFMHPGRILKSKIPKIVKKQHPDTSIKWTSQRWKVREQEKQKIMEMLLPLEEISLRTGAITGFLLKVKQYASRVDKGVMKLKSLSSKLQNASDEKDKNRIQGEIVRTDADVLSSLRKMSIYGSLVSASGGLGAAKETAKLIKKMEKRKRR